MATRPMAKATRAPGASPPRWFITALHAVPLITAAISLGVAFIDAGDAERMLDRWAADGSAERVSAAHIAAVQRRLIVAAAGCAAAWLLLLLPHLELPRRLWNLARRGVALPSRAGRRLAAAARARPADAVVVICMSIVALALGAARLGQTVHYDEAWTYTSFVAKPLLQIVCDYSATNNHILHSLAAHVSCGLLGPEPWALRLPALAAGVACVPAAYAAGRAIAGRGAALLATAAVATWPYLVDQAANARGYSMVQLATLLLLALVPAIGRSQRAGTGPPLATFAVIAAAGFFAVPVMLYPFITIALLVAAAALRAPRGARRMRSRSLLLACGGATALTGVLYWPALTCMAPDNDALARIGALPGAPRLHLEATRFDSVFDGGALTTAHPLGEWSQLATRLWAWWTHGMHPAGAWAFAASVAGGALAAPGLACATVAGIVLTGVLAPLPPPWSLSYLCVLVVLLAAAGAAAATNRCCPDRPRAAVAAAALLALFMTAHNATVLARAPDRVGLPWFIGYADAPAAAAYFRDPARRAAAVHLADHKAVTYYLHLLGVPLEDDRPAGAGPPPADLRYLIDHQTPPVAARRSGHARAQLIGEGFADVEVVHQLSTSHILRLQRME